jgi:hypothetical protein
MIKCKLVKDDGEEAFVVAIHFAKQTVYYDEELKNFDPKTDMYLGDLIYTSRYPLSKAKLKFIVDGEENEFSIIET